MINKDKIINEIIQLDETKKHTKFVSLSKTQEDKNDLLVKKLKKSIKFSKKQSEALEMYLADSGSHRSIGVHSKDGNAEFLSSLPFKYDAEFNYYRYYILPYFDYRFDALEGLYLLVFSQNYLKLYEVNYEVLVETKFEFDTYEESTSSRFENKSMQIHGGDTPVFHGQNAQNEKDKGSDLLNNYTASLSEKLSNFLDKKKGRLAIASTSENIDRIVNELDDAKLAKFHLTGNFEDKTEMELLEMLMSEMESNKDKILETQIDNIDLNKSKELWENSFVDIMSIVNDGRLDKMLVGKLGMDNLDYENPISPLGANYIASAMLKLGGKLQYFQDLDFKLSDNNIVFGLRY